jgi:hypothetical protein
MEASDISNLVVERPLRVLWPAVFVLFIFGSLVMRGADASPTLELAVSHETVSMDEVLDIEVRIVNSTTNNLWVFGDLQWGMGAGLVLNVGPWERDGPLPLFIDHAEFTKEELTDTRSFVRLCPGAFIGRKRQVKVSDLVRKPGEYRISVEYQAPLPAAAFDQPFWSAEKATLFSRAVVLRVTRQTNQKK